jgi:phosphatidate cytidylyltransferase
MQKRIISFAILWLLAIGLPVAFGAPGAVFLIVCAATLTQWEIYQLLLRIGLQGSKKLGLGTGLAFSICAYFGPSRGFSIGTLFAMSVAVVVIGHLFQPMPKRVFQRIGATICGLTLGPFLLSFFTATTALPHGVALTIWITGVTKFTDVGALITGMAIGRTKLAPNLSPKKTREGAVGGVLWSVIVGAGSVALFPQYFPDSLAPLVAGLIAIPVAIAGVSADLFESAVKREAGVKDSGKLIPGIGGAFDLTDSMILAAPVGYALLAPIVS